MTTIFHRRLQGYAFWAVAMLFAVTACHSGSGSVVVSIDPASVELAPLTNQSFQIRVVGTLDQSVTWSLVNSSGAQLTDARFGSIPASSSAGGTYLAPNSVPRDRDNDFFVQATSTVDSTRWARARVHIVPAPLSPSRGPTAGGTHITISGKGFAAGQTHVVFTDKAGAHYEGADVVVESSVLLRVMSPAVPSIGPAQVEIRTGANVVTYPDAFHYGATQLRFSGGQITGVCTSPTAPALVDIDGDGNLDAVSACRYDKTVTILLNDGFGGLEKPVTVPTNGNYPHDVKVAPDLGDGATDIFVSEDLGIEKFQIEGGTLVSKGMAVAFAQCGCAYPYDYYSSKVFMDYNGDGNTDLVFTMNYSNVLLYAPGDGHGLFGAPVFGSATLPVPINLTAADINGDGKDDLLVSFYYQANGTFPGGFSVWMNGGAGAWGPRVDHNTISDYVVALAVGDFNHDGTPDVATASEISQVAVNTVDPTTKAFNPTTFLPVNGTMNLYPWVEGTLLAVDLDRDNFMDLVTSGPQTQVFFGSAAGLGVTAPGGSPGMISVEMVGAPFGILAEHLDPGSTSPYKDLIGWGNTSIEVHPAAGMRTYGSPKVAIGSTPVNLAVDVSHGQLVAALYDGVSQGALGAVDVSTIQGVTPAKQVLNLGPNTVATFVNWADINGDSSPDVLVVDDGSMNGGHGAVWPFIGGASGFTSLGHVDLTQKVTDAQVADLDGDGKPDLVMAENTSGIQGITGDLRIFRGSGDLVFDQSSNVHVAAGRQPYRFRFADLDEDGSTEIVATDYGSARVAVVSFNGTQASAPEFFETGEHPTQIIVADVDGDYIPDLIVLATYPDPSDADVLVEIDVLRGLGHRQFDLPVRYRFGGGVAHGIEYGDVDGDGLGDIAVTVDTPASVQILRGHDGGNFQDVETALAGGLPRGVALCDFDGDGKLDLIVGDAATGSLRLLKNLSR